MTTYKIALSENAKWRGTLHHSIRTARKAKELMGEEGHAYYIFKLKKIPNQKYSTYWEKVF